MADPKNSEIGRFVAHARDKGMDHATIRMLLLATGWKEKDIVEALACTSLELPVPAPPDSGGAREAFLHLLNTAALYAALVAALVIFFTGIDRLWPDPAERGWSGDWYRDTVRWSLAWLLVTFPIHLFTGRLVLRRMLARPEQAFSATRRWLGHMTLFLAAITLAVDLISLLYKLLEGELTMRFLLKVGVVGLLAGLVFGYFLTSLRLGVVSPQATRVRRAFLGAALLVVATSLVTGFSMIGSPTTERARRFDAMRIDHLQEIHRAIGDRCLGDRWRREVTAPLLRPLPTTLEQLAEDATGTRLDLVDPETGEPYGYERIGERRYRLGANFNFARDEKQGVEWNHPPGPVWFEFDVDGR